MKKLLFAAMLFFLGTMLHVPTVSADVKFDEGAAFRLRQEIWDNVTDLDTSHRLGTDRTFFRLRASVWAKADFSQNFGVYGRVTSEPKYFIGPFKPFGPADDSHSDQDEVIFDNIYFDAKNLLGNHLDMRVGRQDFLGPNMYGEGFLLLDGTPGDGSRTFYFNAAKATVKFDQNNSVDLVYIDDPRTDTFLPSLHPDVQGTLYVDNKKLLTASLEQGFVVYGRTKPIQNLTLEPYYIYKIEDSFATTPELKLNTVGARVVYAMDGGWKFGGEYAYQFGEYDSGGLWHDRRGNGGYVFVSRKYDNVSLKPEWDLRYIYLSGDKPGDNKNDTWDPLFSRNPYWNEILIYSLPNETAKEGGAVPGYWTNLEMLRASVKLNFTQATNLALAYHYLWAPEKPDLTILSPIMFGTGHERGHLPTAILSHTFSKNVDGMLQLEYFVPSHSYYSNKAETATFFRWQLQFRI